MDSFLNIKSDTLRLVGFVALSFFVLFIISKVVEFNDKLLGRVILGKEGFSNKSKGRTEVDHEAVIRGLKEIEKKNLLLLHFPEHKNDLTEELDDYLDNIKLEELVLLNTLIVERNKSKGDKKFDTIFFELANKLNAYKYIREAIERVDI